MRSQSQHHNPLTFPIIDGFSRVIDEPVRDMLGTSSFLLSLRTMSSWVTWVFNLVTDGSRVRISLVADDEIVS